jgi:hypothetical protein
VPLQIFFLPISMTEEDIISTLPDEILCHILSFLETEQSVATTILSKRWNHLWRSVSTLCFKTIFTNKDFNFDFNDFVYSVLCTDLVHFALIWAASLSWAVLGYGGDWAL